MRRLVNAAKDRGDVLAAAVAVGIAIGVRCTYFQSSGDVAGWNGMVLMYGNIAANLIHGHGYVMNTPLSLIAWSGHSQTIIPAARAWALASGPREVPMGYLLPGYPCLIAVIWTLTGTMSNASVQVIGLFIDGVTMTVGPWLMLRSLGRRWAGVLAALLCAISLPLITLSARMLPDGLTTDLVVWALVTLVVLRRRPVLAAAVSGLTIGLTFWLRADALAAVPLIAVVIVAAAPAPRWVRVRAALAFLGGVAIMDASLGAFLWHVYGGLHLTRPGLGVLLGQGIEDYPNPWHFGPIPGNVFGEEAPQRALVLRHHLTWGTSAADSLLLHQALSYITQRPGWFLAICWERMVSVVTLSATGAPPPWWQQLGLFSAAGVWFLRRERFAVLAVGALWVGRVTPFSVLHVESRYVAALIPLYAIVVAVGVLDTAAILRRWPLVSRAGKGKAAAVSVSPDAVST